MENDALLEKLRSSIHDVELSAKADWKFRFLGDSLDEVLSRHISMEWHETPLLTRIANLSSLGEHPGKLGLVSSIQTLSDGRTVRVCSMTTLGKTYVFCPSDISQARLDSGVLITELRDLGYRLLGRYGKVGEPLWKQFAGFLEELDGKALLPALTGGSEEATRLAPLMYRSCQKTGTVRYLETIEEERDVFGFDETGTLQISEDTRTWDGDGSRVCLWCSACDRCYEIGDHDFRGSGG